MFSAEIKGISNIIRGCVLDFGADEGIDNNYDMYKALKKEYIENQEYKNHPDFCGYVEYMNHIEF